MGTLFCAPASFGAIFHVDTAFCLNSTSNPEKMKLFLVLGALVALTVAEVEEGEIENNCDENSEVYYDKKKSFFDSISCEATEKAKGRSNKPDWRAEKKLNRETFGVSGNNRRGYYRRGGQNGGPGGGGGYNNYNNRGGGGGYNNYMNGGRGGYSNQGFNSRFARDGNNSRGGGRGRGWGGRGQRVGNRNAD